MSCAAAMFTSRGAAPDLADSAAATPAAWPSAMTQPMTRTEPMAARVAELQAINTYNQALVALSLQEGTILKRSGVSVEPDARK